MDPQSETSSGRYTQWQPWPSAFSLQLSLFFLLGPKGLESIRQNTVVLQSNSDKRKDVNCKKKQPHIFQGTEVPQGHSVKQETQAVPQMEDRKVWASNPQLSKFHCTTTSTYGHVQIDSTEAGEQTLERKIGGGGGVAILVLPPFHSFPVFISLSRVNNSFHLSKKVKFILSQWLFLALTLLVAWKKAAQTLHPSQNCWLGCICAAFFQAVKQVFFKNWPT